MEQGNTPEEKLLNLIRKGPRAQEQTGEGLKQSMEGTDLGAKDKKEKDVSLTIFRHLDLLLILVIVVLIGYIVYEVVLGKRKDKIEYIVPQETSLVNRVTSAEETSDTKPFEYYGERIKQRDIFESVVKKKAPEKKPEKVERKPEAPKFTKKLRVVGIVLDETSEAIIEDRGEKKTYFLHKGESIGGAVIEDIQENKVILRFHEETIELVP